MKILAPLVFMLFFSIQCFSNEKLFYVSGKVTNIEIVQDDISFYTWSIYLDVKLPKSLVEYGFDHQTEIEVEAIKKKDDQHPKNVHKFGRQGFHSEKDAKKFTNLVRNNKKMCFEIRESYLIKYLRAKAYMFSIEQILPNKDC